MIQTPPKLEPVVASDSKTFRDPVHKDIELRGWEVDIINTAEFQRLRRIKQLGLADLVYAGAVHNRFLHSLGTLHMAQVMIDHINHNSGPDKPISDKTEETIRSVALLHDIGHLPFGHTLEKECNLLKTRHDQWERLKHYIGEDSDIARVLGAKELYKAVVSALRALETGESQGETPLFVADIVGNTICADLLDYLKRDGLACGLNLEYDERVFKYFAIQDSRLVVLLEKHGQYRRDTVSELLSVLRNRYSLAEKVIFHHTKLTASAMLAKAFQLSGLSEQDIRYKGQEELLAQLTKNENLAVVRLSEALQNRKLHKMFFLVPREYALIENRLAELHRKFYDEPDTRLEFERTLEHAFGLDEGSVIIYCPNQEMLFKPADVLIVPKSGAMPVKLSAVGVPEIQGEVRSLKDKHEALWRMCLFIDPGYLYLAKEIAEEFKKQMSRAGIKLENALDMRPTPRWDLLLLADEVVEEFFKGKNLSYSEKQELGRDLAIHAPSARTEEGYASPTNRKALKETLREQAESWYRIKHGEETS